MISGQYQKAFKILSKGIDISYIPRFFKLLNDFQGNTLKQWFQHIYDDHLIMVFIPIPLCLIGIYIPWGSPLVNRLGIIHSLSICIVFDGLSALIRALEVLLGPPRSCKRELFCIYAHYHAFFFNLWIV